MAVPEKFKNLANAVRNEMYGSDVREAIAKSIEESGTSSENAIKITEQLIDGSFDEGVLNTEIERKLNELEEEYAPELNSVKSQLAQIAINPTKYGAIFDGVTDDSLAIQNAIDEAEANGTKEVLLSGEIGIASPIELKHGVSLNSYNARIIALEDVNIFEFNRNTKIKGTVHVDVAQVDYTSDVLYFDGSKRLSYRDISIDKIFVEGHHVNGMGNAIHFDCTVEQSDISFVQFGEVVVRGFEKGVFLDAPSIQDTTYSNYINANMFDKLIISDCEYYIYGTGSHEENNDVDGNTFTNVQLQYSGRAKEMIHLEGRDNVINVFAWDASPQDVLVVNLTESSLRNVINIYGSSNINRYNDYGTRNIVTVLDSFYDVAPITSPRNNRREWELRYEGDYQDILHKADILHYVTDLGDSSFVTSGEISRIFNGMTHDALRLNLSGDREYSFEIEFDGTKFVGHNDTYLYGGLKNLGFVFDWNTPPKTIEIVVTDNNGTERTTTINCVGKENNPYFNITRNSINGLASAIQKIRVVFKGQIGQYVQVSRMYASSFYTAGNKFLSNAGGFMAGNIDMGDNYIRLGHRGAMPIATEGHRGRVFHQTAAFGSGIADKTYVCIKNEDDGFEWKEI